MKGFEKFLLIVFSLIMILISVCILLVSTGIVDVTGMFVSMKIWLVANKMYSVVIGAVLAILGLIGVFAPAESSEEKKGGLAIKSEKGTVYITRDTFENIILAVTRGYAELVNVKVDVAMSEEGVSANVMTSILPDTVVPALTSKLQENIKASVLKQTTVDIKEVNIKIRGVYVEPQKR